MTKAYQSGTNDKWLRMKIVTSISNDELIEGRSDFLPLLSKIALDHNLPISQHAFNAIANIDNGTGIGFSHLNGILDKVTDKHVKYSFAKTLAKIGRSDAIEMLVQNYYNDEYHKTRAVVASEAWRLRTSAISHVLKELLEDPEPKVRKEAALSMAETGTYEFTIDLYRQKEKEDNQVAKDAIIKALSMLNRRHKR